MESIPPRKRLFICPQPKDIPVIFHTDQETSTVGIGKSTQRTRNLLTVAHFEFKIKLLVFPLLYQRFYRMHLLHFGNFLDRQN